MILNNGNKNGGGGKRKGSGRKTENFKSELKKLNQQHDILGNVYKMALGIISVSDKVRLSASLWLLEMEHGKATQALSVDPDSNRIIVEFKQ